MADNRPLPTSIWTVEDYYRVKDFYEARGLVFNPALERGSPAAYHVVAQAQLQANRPKLPKPKAPGVVGLNQLGQSGTTADKTANPSLTSYFAEIDAVETGWWESELPAWQRGEGGRIIGASPWNHHRDKLAAIDRRHGIAPDDPRVYSIRAYKSDLARVELQWKQECEQNGWTSWPPQESPNDPKPSIAFYRHGCRRDDLSARHFGRLLMESGHETESRRHLWAYVTRVALLLLETTPRSMNANLRSVDPELQRVYSALHELQVPWADKPPYQALTRQESIDKLRSIANQLEADDVQVINVVNPVASLVSNGATPPAGKLSLLIDLLTTDELAKLAGVGKARLLNVLSDARTSGDSDLPDAAVKGSGARGDQYSYEAIRPFLVRKWPLRAATGLFPESFADAKDWLRLQTN